MDTKWFKFVMERLRQTFDRELGAVVKRAKGERDLTADG